MPQPGDVVLCRGVCAHRVTESRRRPRLPSFAATDVANVAPVTDTVHVDWALLEGLPPEDVRRVIAIARRRTFRKGEVVFDGGDLAETLHLIVTGRFAVRGHH